MKRREFIQVASITTLSLLVNGCKSFAGKSRNILQVDQYINTDGTTVLKVKKQLFNDKQYITIAYEKNAIGLVQYNNTYIASLLVCTHLGCGVEFNNNDILKNNTASYICPCHGAKFSSTGKRLSGPATKDLTTFTTTSDEHFIFIYI